MQNQPKNNRLKESYSPRASLNIAKRNKSTSKPTRSLQNKNIDDKFSPKSIDLKIASFSTTVSQSLNSTDLRFSTLNSPKAIQKPIQSYLGDVKKSLPEDISYHPSGRIFTRPKLIKLKPETAKTTQKGAFLIENSTELRKWKKSAKIKSKTSGKGLSELMQLMYKKSIKDQPNNDSQKNLPGKLNNAEPEEVFRTMPSPKNKFITKNQEKKLEWTEEHEQALRRSPRSPKKSNSFKNSPRNTADSQKHVIITELPINTVDPSDQARESYRLEVEAQRINNLLKEILSTRKEMWKYYLGRVNHSELNDQNLTRLLSHESVYAKEQSVGKHKGIIWEESVIRLGAGDDVIQHVTPESLRGKPTDIIIANLSKELSQAIIAKDQARIKFYSLQNKIEDFYKKINPDPVGDDPFLRKCLTIKEIPDKEEIPVLKSRKSFNPMFGGAESLVGNMVREASSRSFRVVG